MIDNLKIKLIISQYGYSDVSSTFYVENILSDHSYELIDNYGRKLNQLLNQETSTKGGVCWINDITPDEYHRNSGKGRIFSIELIYNEDRLRAETTYINAFDIILNHNVDGLKYLIDALAKEIFNKNK